MTSNFKKVLEFNKCFNIPSHFNPQRDIWSKSPTQVEYRLSLIREEVGELEDAIKGHDLIETVDALTDILYVVYGAYTAFGVDADKAFELVHNSNMSKLCKSEDEAKETVEHYLKDTRYNPAYKPSDDGKYFIVYDQSLGKILKSVRYSPVDLSELV